MVFKPVSLAILVLAAQVGAAHAQSANDFAGPRETPPSSFTGQQFVDSRGCVFLRAGLAGRTNWVPRVTQDRKQLCGYPPTFGREKIEIAEEAPKAAPAPAPAPAATGRRPIETVATTTASPRIREVPPKTAARVPADRYAAPKVANVAPPPSEAAPKRVVVPQVAAVAVPEAAPQPVVRAARGKPANGCYADAPVREVFDLRGGGTITLCTAGNGSLTNARPPRLAGGAASVSASGYARADGSVSPSVSVSSQNGKPPKGYKNAWQDDRLNPNRGKGTAAGWAEQDQVWTRETPAQLVEGTTKAGKKVIVVRRVSVSSKSSPVEATTKVAKPSQGGKTYVQVGTFGVPSNADAAARGLKGIGLPVARAKTTKSGKALQIVMAGPFTSARQAEAALTAARRAGFKDAFIR